VIVHFGSGYSAIVNIVHYIIMSSLRKYSIDNLNLDDEYLKKIKHPLVEGYRDDQPPAEVTVPQKVTNDEKTNTCYCWPSWLRSR